MNFDINRNDFSFHNMCIYVYCVYIQYLFAWEDSVQDLLFETIAVRRIALVAKLVAISDCSDEEKDVALAWLGELTNELGNRLDEYEKENPQGGGESGGWGGFQ